LSLTGEAVETVGHILDHPPLMKMATRPPAFADILVRRLYTVMSQRWDGEFAPVSDKLALLEVSGNYFYNSLHQVACMFALLLR